jgi:hypothetical protein
MKNALRIVLQASPEEQSRLEALQSTFAEVCNALAPRVRDTRCWNRVTLHHLAYKDLRERFPRVGSQMICNAIYSVCRAARAVYQGPASPFKVNAAAGKALPLIRFSDRSPVFFDRHTLSLRGDELSLYTLDGRLRFRGAAGQLAEAGLPNRRLREVVMTRRADGMFQLDFLFAEGEAPAAGPTKGRADETIPDYVKLETET